MSGSRPGSVFDQLWAEALAAFDRIVGLDLTEVALDGSLHKAPTVVKAPARTPLTGANAAGSGPSPWIVTTSWWGWTIDGANRNDVRMLEPTLDDIAAVGLHAALCLAIVILIIGKLIAGATAGTRSSAYPLKS